MRIFCNEIPLTKTKSLIKINIIDFSSCFFPKIDKLPLVLALLFIEASKNLIYGIQDSLLVNLFDGGPLQNHGDFKLRSFNVLWNGNKNCWLSKICE